MHCSNKARSPRFPPIQKQAFAYRNWQAKRYLKKVKSRPICAHADPAKVKVTTTVEVSATCNCSDPLQRTRRVHASDLSGGRIIAGEQGHYCLSRFPCERITDCLQDVRFALKRKLIDIYNNNDRSLHYQLSICDCKYVCVKFVFMNKFE